MGRFFMPPNGCAVIPRDRSVSKVLCFGHGVAILPSLKRVEKWWNWGVGHHLAPDCPHGCLMGKRRYTCV